jgi:peptidoglycan/LPS O-acetylase OafA/YrhL
MPGHVAGLKMLRNIVRIDRLDGLRAIAILMVLLFHEGYLSQGWAGVDLFFVLSGFLITGTLRKTRTNQNYWSRFYWRRAARILPPVLLLMFVYSLAVKPKIQTILGYTLFAGNIMNRTLYGRTILAPLWSLAVEEHFYILLPVVILMFNRRKLIIGLIALLVAEPILRGALTPFAASWETYYYLTPVRMDGLAAGSLLALLTEDGANRSIQQVAGWVAIFLASTLSLINHLDHSFVRHSNGVAFNSIGYSLVTATAVCILAWVLSIEGTFADTVLSWKPLTYIGRISYGAYLFHMPLIEEIGRLAKRSPLLKAPGWLLPIDLAVVFVMSALSFHFIEQPIIRSAKIRSEIIVEEGEYWWRTKN